MLRKLKKNRLQTGLWPALALVALVIAVGLVVFFRNHNKPHITPTPQASVPQLQNDRTSSSPKTASSPQDVNQGTAIDNHGSGTADTLPSQWTRSQSGLLTVKGPSYNSTVKSGDTLSGSSSDSQVQFRLVDEQVGVIAQGILSVVDGNFSGKLNFSSYGSNGRLDVFTAGPDGQEANEVQVPVSF